MLQYGLASVFGYSTCVVFVVFPPPADWDTRYLLTADKLEPRPPFNTDNESHHDPDGRGSSGLPGADHRSRLICKGSGHWGKEDIVMQGPARAW